MTYSPLKETFGPMSFFLDTRDKEMPNSSLTGNESAIAKRQNLLNSSNCQSSIEKYVNRTEQLKITKIAFTHRLFCNPNRFIVGEGTTRKDEGTVPLVFGWHALCSCS